MPTVIERMGARLIFDKENYRWISDIKPAERLFNLLLDPLGPEGADPNPGATAAQEAVKRVGGTKIIELEETDPIIRGLRY